MVLPMIVLAGATALSGLISVDEAGRVVLTYWLPIQVVGGVLACMVGGRVARRVSGRREGVRALALGVLALGGVEAVAIVGAFRSGQVEVQVSLAAIAPLLAAAGVLVGGRIGSPADSSSWGGGARRRWPPDLWRWAVPFAAMGLAGVLAGGVLPLLPVGPRTDVVAAALGVDLTLGPAALTFGLLVRSGRARWFALLPPVVLGYLLTTALFPPRYPPSLDQIGWLVLPLELALIGTLVVLARRSLRLASSERGDLVTRIRAAATQALGNRIVAGILATEIGLVYHAFRPPSTGYVEAPESFTLHRKAGYGGIVLGLSLAIVAETAGVHMSVRAWSGVAAWIMTGLSVYSLLWLLGDARAMGARPTLLTDDELWLRLEAYAGRPRFPGKRSSERSGSSLVRNPQPTPSRSWCSERRTCA